MEQSAKRYGIKSIGKIARKAGKKVRRRAKTAMSYPRSRGGTRYTNGRSFKSRRKPRRLIKGTPEAKRYMAKIRRMRA